MLYKVNTLKGYKLSSIDGEIGIIKDFYFDDDRWTIRYLVIETANWLMDRQVLISPYVLRSVDTQAHCINVDLTRKQIEGSPLLDTHKPVSRHFETEYYAYYGMPTYWGGLNIWNTVSNSIPKNTPIKETVTGMATEDFHLRSTLEVNCYNIKTSDGEIGHVDDFIVDDETWAIRYLVIDTKNWMKGKMVLISPSWIERVSWEESKVFVNLTKESIKLSPEFTEEALITRDYETNLHQYYHLDGYWVAEAVAEQQIHL